MNDAPAAVTFARVLGFSTAVTTVTYRDCVRSTALGARLNGRRSARSLPQATPVSGNAPL